MIPDSIIEEISRRTDIVELVGGYVSLKPVGARYMGLCPFHSEKTPSFSVNPEIGAFYCFGCHKGGSAFNFIMEMEGMNFPEAVKFLGDRVGVEVAAEQDDEGNRKRKALLELYSRVATTYAYFLRENRQGEHALGVIRERAISEQATSEFGLGYAPADPFWLRGFLEKKEYSAGFLDGCGLFTRANPRRSLFTNRLMFPIRNRRGDVIAFGGRLLEGDGPKYINSPETEIFHKGASLYAVDVASRQIRSSKQVLLAEGYMDVIALHMAGATNAVAPLGTALTDDHAGALERMCDTAVLVFDGDEAGIRATSRAAIILERHGLSCLVAPMAPGTDPADLVRGGGSQALGDAISSPLTALEFLVRKGLGSVHGHSPEGKAFVLNEVFPYISVMRSEVKRGESLRLAADLVGVDREAAGRDYERYRRSSETERTGRGSGSRVQQTGPPERKGRELKPSTRGSGTQTSHDLFLMLATIGSRGHFAYVRQWIQPGDLEDPVARELYVALEESFRREESSLELLLERIADPAVTEVVRRRLATGEFDGIHEQAIRDGVRSIRRRALEAKVREVELTLRRAATGAGEDLDEVELLAEKMYLDKELQKLKGEGG